MKSNKLILLYMVAAMLILSPFYLKGSKNSVLINNTDSFVDGFVTLIRKPTNINELKTTLNQMPKEQEKAISKKIQVKKEGIVFNGTVIPTNKESVRILTVRLTTYWSKGGDTDSDSRRARSSTGYTLREGDSIAVDPRLIDYGADVIIPNVGLVKAVDTGTDVKTRKASAGKLPVIDVYFEHKKDALRFANTYPKIVKVAVLN